MYIVQSKTYTNSPWIDDSNCIFSSASQISMSVLANVSNLSSGMGLGFPAITYQSLTNKTDPLALSDDEASWFGKHPHLILFIRKIQINGENKSLSQQQ